MYTPEPGGDHPCAKCVHPETVVLDLPSGRPGLRWRWRGVDHELQTTKTLIEPRLELPGLPERVLELPWQQILLDNLTTIIGKGLLLSCNTVLLCSMSREDYIILIVSAERATKLAPMPAAWTTR